MTTKLKTRMQELAEELKSSGELTALSFFQSARRQPWGAKLSTEQLIEGYNETLGRLFGLGQLTIEEVRKAQQA